jgi:small neutral amino acid transporter SnatA (MarC family)
MLLALFIMVIFNYVGVFLLAALEVDTQTIFLSGGLILFLIAIRMIFPSKKEVITAQEKPKEEPFIFPLATPMIAGPSCLTTIMLYSHQDSRNYVILAILVAWAFSIIILLLAQRIKDIVGKRALLAIERLMGLVLTMMAMEMLLKGLKSIALEGIK